MKEGTMKDTNVLFQPVRIRTVTVPNRFVRSATVDNGGDNGLCFPEPAEALRRPCEWRCGTDHYRNDRRPSVGLYPAVPESFVR